MLRLPINSGMWAVNDILFFKLCLELSPVAKLQAWSSVAMNRAHLTPSLLPRLQILHQVSHPQFCNLHAVFALMFCMYEKHFTLAHEYKLSIAHTVGLQPLRLIITFWFVRRAIWSKCIQISFQLIGIKLCLTVSPQTLTCCKSKTRLITYKWEQKLFRN